MIRTCRGEIWSDPSIRAKLRLIVTTVAVLSISGCSHQEEDAGGAGKPIPIPQTGKMIQVSMRKLTPTGDLNIFFPGVGGPSKPMATDGDGNFYFAQAFEKNNFKLIKLTSAGEVHIVSHSRKIGIEAERGNVSLEVSSNGNFLVGTKRYLFFVSRSGKVRRITVGDNIPYPTPLGENSDGDGVVYAGSYLWKFKDRHIERSHKVPKKSPYASGNGAVDSAGNVYLAVNGGKINDNILKVSPNGKKSRLDIVSNVSGTSRRIEDFLAMNIINRHGRGFYGIGSFDGDDRESTLAVLSVHDGKSSVVAQSRKQKNDEIDSCPRDKQISRRHPYCLQQYYGVQSGSRLVLFRSEFPAAIIRLSRGE